MNEVATGGGPGAGPGAPRAADWAAAPERSNRFALALMAWIAVRLGRRIARGVLLPVTLYFVCFAPTARRHSARYLERALGRRPTLADSWRHFHTFASTVLDRIYFARGALHEFDVQLNGAELVDATLAEGRGAFLLGAHIGSFEALHAVGQSRQQMRVAMVMYPDNARLIHAVLQSVAPQFELNIIPIGRAGSTLAIRDWLDGGGLAGLLGDRFLPGDPARAGSVALPFLGRTAHFGDGPLRLAQLLRRRVIFMVGLYHGGRRYEVRFEPLADFRERTDDAGERERLVREAMRAYVAKLEALVREAPYNWFNFHDFWHEA
ncbi:MAG: acyl-CoA synthetase [Rubrivivax sp.]|nr:acyl-CoA synthetase [Rubrivivax sp.]